MKNEHAHTHTTRRRKGRNSKTKRTTHKKEITGVVVVVVAAAAVVCRRRLVCRVSRSRFVVVISRFGLESSFVGGFQQCRSHQAVSPRWRGIAQRCGRNVNGAGGLAMKPRNALHSVRNLAVPWDNLGH